MGNAVGRIVGLVIDTVMMGTVGVAVGILPLGLLEGDDSSEPESIFMVGITVGVSVFLDFPIVSQPNPSQLIAGMSVGLLDVGDVGDRVTAGGNVDGNVDGIIDG